jgi:hypothetical protein
VALISASPGALGGLRSQIALQLSLSKLGVLVIPDSFALSGAHLAFDEQGRLKDATAERRSAIVARLSRRRLTPPIGFINVSRTRGSPDRTRTARPASIKTSSRDSERQSAGPDDYRLYHAQLLSFFPFIWAPYRCPRRAPFFPPTDQLNAKGNTDAGHFLSQVRHSVIV